MRSRDSDKLLPAVAASDSTSSSSSSLSSSDTSAPPDMKWRFRSIVYHFDFYFSNDWRRDPPSFRQDNKQSFTWRRISLILGRAILDCLYFLLFFIFINLFLKDLQLDMPTITSGIGTCATWPATKGTCEARAIPTSTFISVVVDAICANIFFSGI